MFIPAASVKAPPKPKILWYVAVRLSVKWTPMKTNHITQLSSCRSHYLQETWVWVMLRQRQWFKCQIRQLQTKTVPMWWSIGPVTYLRAGH